MSKEQKLQSPLKSRYVLITDPKVLEMIRLEEEEEMKNGKEALYIAPNETEETFDQEIILGQGHDFVKSSTEVGQLRPIEVAIWFDDPNKNTPNSIERVHRRIINGRHRYKADPTWRREYYDFSGFSTQQDPLRPAIEYHLAKGHFDMQKKASKAERTVWVRNMCQLAMKMGATQGITEVCSWVVDLAQKQGISSGNAIREVCEDQFKNTEMRSRRQDKTFESQGVDTIEVKKLKKVAGEKFQELEATKLKLIAQNDQQVKEIDGLMNDNKKLNSVMEDLQQQLRIVANISHEAKCQCGKLTEIKVDASSGRIIITDKK